MPVNCTVSIVANDIRSTIFNPQKVPVMNQQTGKYIIIGGVVIVVAGILVYFFHNKLTWFGRLPGDIRVEKENYRFYFPIVSMLLISLLLTLIINILRKL